MWGFDSYLLPPIIFYAGLSVKKKQFFRNFATIASFGIFGTYIAFALIAIVLYGIAQLPNVLDLSVRHPSRLASATLPCAAAPAANCPGRTDAPICCLARQTCVRDFRYA